MLSYEFDILGIVYTALIGALFLALFVSALFLIIRIRPSSAGTVVLRVLDIVLIVVLAVVWAVFILTKAEIFGLRAVAAEGGLAFLAGGAEAFTVPGVGGLVAIWDSVFGIVLLGLLTAAAIANLVLAFALRRKHGKRMGKQEKTALPASSVEAELPAEGQNMLFELMAGIRDEFSAPEEKTEPDVTEIPDAARPTELSASAEPLPEPSAEPIAVGETPLGEGTEAPPAVRTVYADDRPMGGNVSAKIYASAVQKPESANGFGKMPQAEPAAQQEKPDAFRIVPPALPVTKKLVITNRRNVVNMFNDYLNDKEKDEREKLSGNIGKIIIK